MFAEMLKEICKKRDSCVDCPWKSTCHVIDYEVEPAYWDESKLKNANRKMDRAMARALAEV